MGLLHWSTRPVELRQEHTETFMHRGQMIHGIVLLCIVPSSMALSPHCPTGTLSQRPVCDSPLPHCSSSLSHDPIVRVLAYQHLWSHCQLLHGPTVPLSHCPMVHCRIVYCPSVPVPHRLIAAMSSYPLSRYPWSHGPNVPLCIVQRPRPKVLLHRMTL